MGDSWAYCTVKLKVTIRAGTDYFNGEMTVQCGGETPGAAMARVIRALPPSIQVRDAQVKEGSE